MELWLGIGLALADGVLFYRGQSLSGIPLVHTLIAAALIINGWYLSFKVSPMLLQREKSGQARELLPASWRRKIILSLVISNLGWWGGLLLLAVYLIYR